MSTFDKAKDRILSKPKDYTYTEARILLTHLGYKEFNKGKTSGSRVKFYREIDDSIILLHKPHPGDVMKHYAVVNLYDKLKETGEI